MERIATRMWYGRALLTLGLGVTVSAGLAACGGGSTSVSTVAGVAPVGGAPSAAASAPVPAPSPTALPTTSTQSSAGRVVDYTSGAPIANAIVYVGQTLILGATPPPTVPAGDVQTTTAADGTFSIRNLTPTTIACVLPNPTAPTTSNGVVSTCTANVMVFTTDHITLHTPIQLSAPIGTLKVSTASANDTAWLQAINNDRAKYGAAPVVMDERLMEAARLWNAYEAANGRSADTDTLAPAPYSTSVSLSGSFGGYDDQVAQNGTGGSSSTSSGQFAESQFATEGPTGPHFSTIIAGSERWTGFGEAPCQGTTISPCHFGAEAYTEDMESPPTGI